MVPGIASDDAGAALILAFTGRDLWAAFEERTGGRAA
jgi:hypothetical protein